MGQRKSASEYRVRDQACLWHPYTRFSTLREGPVPIMVRAEGPFLYDVEGKRYVDVIASWWACCLGHSHPKVVEAIRRQAGELQHSILGGMSHVRAIELAERLVSLFPTPERRVLFASDGSSAVEAALKIALQYFYNCGKSQKRRFVALTGSYHGDTLGSLQVGYVPAFHRPFEPVLPPVYRAEAPRCSRCRFGEEVSTCSLRCLSSVQEILCEHAEEVAALIVEPLCQAASGMHMYPAAYLTKLAALCREYGVLLIVDEIATGFGRTGRFFAFEHAGVDPPIVCLGKALTGGYLPLSATVVAEEIYRTFSDTPSDHTFYHGHTFSGNPIAAAASLAVLDLYREEGIPAQARATGMWLKEALSQFSGHALVRDVRLLGMIGAVELQPQPGLARRIRTEMVRKGYLVRPLGDVVYLMPPLVIDTELLAEALEVLMNLLDVEGRREA